MAPSSAAPGRRASHCACAEPSPRRRLGSALAGRRGRRRAGAGPREAAAAPPGKPAARLAQRGAGPRSPVPARGKEGGRPAGRQPRPRCATGFRPAPRLPPSAPLWCDPAGSGDPGRGRLKAHKPGGNNAPEGFGPEGCSLGAANCCAFLPELVFSAWLHARKGLLAGGFLPGFVSLLNGTGPPLQTKGLPKLFKKTAVAVNEACSEGSSGFCACNFLSRQAQQHLRHLLFLVLDCLVNWSETRSSMKGKEGQSII
ncbi:unnamed protein product [Caretta caretta]